MQHLMWCVSSICWSIGYYFKYSLVHYLVVQVIFLPFSDVPEWAVCVPDRSDAWVVEPHAGPRGPGSDPRATHRLRAAQTLCSRGWGQWKHRTGYQVLPRGEIKDLNWLKHLKKIVELMWEKGNFLRKHSLHGKNSSLGFIEAVHQIVIKDVTPLNPPSIYAELYFQMFTTYNL